MSRDHVSVDGATLPLRVAPARAAAAPLLVLAPGAGSSMAHPGVRGLQDRLVARGITTATFDFPYRVRGGGAPDRMPVLVQAYRAVIDHVRRGHAGPLFAGGRSLGGRVASHVAAAGTHLAGLVFFAFPLHPPGRPGIARAEHLKTLRVPMLFVQGTRDTFARADLLDGVLRELPIATYHPIVDADHGFHVPKRTGRTDADVLDELADVAARWMREV